MKPTSFSQNVMFNKCKRQWWYSYVRKIPSTADMSYADAGNVLHKTLEYYYKDKTKTLDEVKIFFNNLWHEKKLHDGILKMRQDEYWLMAINGVQLNKEFTSVEAKIFFDDVVGYLDGVNTTENTVTDWKSSTRTTFNEEEYTLQMKFYSYLYSRKFNRLPDLTKVYYLKSTGSKQEFVYKPTEKDVEEMNSWHNNIRREMEEIRQKDIIPEKGYDCKFCPYVNLCNETEGALKFNIQVLGNYLKVNGTITDLLHKGLNKNFSYELKNAFFIKKARPMARTTVEFWNMKKQLLPIGFKDKLVKVLKNYSDYKKLPLVIDIEDKRIFNEDKISMPDKLLTKELREYQDDAVTTMIRKKIGMMEAGTGSGKTIISAEIIRRLGYKTLFLVDKIELLRQTKEVFEKELGIPIGTIGAGEDNIEHITVATVQTLVHNLKKYADYLASVRVCQYDECHHVSSRSIQKISHYLNNTEFRCGLSATTYRDDKNDMQINAVTGYKEVDLSASKLIEMGFLAKPHIHFIENFMTDEYEDKLIADSKTMLINETPNYNKYYENFISRNELRNNAIKKIVDNNPNKRILVLTKLIEHGNHLANLLGGVHLYGNTKKDDRLAMMSDFKNGKIKVLVSTVSIFSEGIDIPQLDIIANLSGNRGDVKSIQMLGRVMRLFEGKDKAEYYDFYDTYRWFRQASRARINVFISQGHVMDKINANEI